jgi:sec-independent protein translocase protein TatB
MGVPPQIELGNLGMADSLILMVLALVVFGPRRLPQIGRQIGKLMYEFRKASNDFKFQMEEELRLSEDADRRKKEEAERARNLALNPPSATETTVESQAGIGAVEQASVSAQPPAMDFPGEASGTAENSAETGSAEAAAEETQMRYPRINPPSTGEPIPAARRGARPGMEPPADVSAETSPAETSVAAEGNIDAEPAPAVSEPQVATEPELAVEPQVAVEGAANSSGPGAEPARTETVSQHG